MPLGYAANRENTAYIAPSVGYYHFSDKRDLDDDALWLLAGGFNFTSDWSVEAAYARIKTQSDTEPKPNVDINMYLFDLLYHFNSDQNFEPYVLAGFGVLNIDDSTSNDPNDLVNGNVGVGLEYFFDRSVALRVDIRDLYTFSGGKNDLMATLGVRILFPF